METNDSNIKPQSTGGLKLMTVFVLVIAAHVLVLGGFTVYHLMNGGSSDSDLVTDKAHKGLKVTPDGSVAMDGQLPEASQTDKTATASTAPTDVTQAPAPTNETPAPIDNTTAPAKPATQDVANTPMSAPAPAAPTGPVITPPPTTAPTGPVAMEPVTTPASQPEPQVAGSYVVKSHDTLASIAHHNHSTVAKLKTANNLKGDVLHIGQKLVIPGGTAIAATPTTTPDATTPATDLSDSPTTSPAKPSHIAKTATAKTKAPVLADHHTYTVVKGDTLTKIAHKFKTTPNALMAANSITDPAKLSIGKKLKIPSVESRSATTATPTTTAPTSSVKAKAAPTGQLANFVQ